MNETINYILSLLLYGNDEARQLIGYTANREEWSRLRLVIVPKRERLTDLYVPDLSQSPEIEKVGNTLVVNTDIVYNTFFLISRAEEMLCDKRDEHGRFLARHSVLGKHNLLLIPTIDEYSRILCKALNLGLPPKRIAHINLTHDIDVLTRYRSLRSQCGAALRGEWSEAFRALSDIHNDPAYTFPWLIDADNHLCSQTDIPTSVIYFLKYGPATGLDLPQYHHSYLDLPRLAQQLNRSGAKFALHSSYLSGKEFGRIAPEFHNLSSLLSKWNIACLSANRNHYLRSTSPEHFAALEKAGITDDYSMGFADAAGFRLGTTRPVRWIDPTTARLSNLTLHPLTVMDCSLSDERYLHLNEDEAYYYCQRLIEQTRRHNGELNLLWHNTSFSASTYHKQLYNFILDYIIHNG